MYQLDEEDLSAERRIKLEENRIFSALREIVLYSLFICVLLFVSYSKQDPKAYSYQLSVKTLLGMTPDGLQDVNLNKEVWSWISDGLVDALNGRQWYNDQVTSTDSRFISDHSTYLIGNVLLRQSRITES